jgi:hypothetical protein
VMSRHSFSAGSCARSAFRKSTGIVLWTVPARIACSVMVHISIPRFGLTYTSALPRPVTIFQMKRSRTAPSTATTKL